MSKPAGEGGAFPATPGEPWSPADAAQRAGFAQGGAWDASPPSAGLAAALHAVSGPDWRCPAATHDELIGLLRQWQALESWAAAGKLGVLRALMLEEAREEARAVAEPGLADLTDGAPRTGGAGQAPAAAVRDRAPGGWTKSLVHETALALAMPPQSADRLIATAWDLEVRLPRTGALLAGGAIGYAKARAVAEALAALSDEDAARAEARIAPDLPGKTFGQAERIAVQAALAIDPGYAVRRREEAERNRARVALRRDPSGAASLSGYDLPADETLAAYANVAARATEYRDSGAFPGVRMDQFRAMAYLDLMNAVTADSRIALGQPSAGLGAPNEYGPGEPTQEGPGDADPGQPGGADPDRPGGADPGQPGGADPDRPGGADPGQPGGADPDRPGGGDPRRPPDGTPDPPGGAGAAQPPRPADLVIPLATLLGLADRPGESHGFGPLDPGLCRSLSAIAANSARTTLCITVTDASGIAVAHGCTRPARRRPGQPPGRPASRPLPLPRALAALPARINLTIPASRLPALARPPGRDPHPAAHLAPPAGSRRGAGGPPHAAQPGDWQFARLAGPPSPGGPDDDVWLLTLPDGTVRTTRLSPLPAEDCDHRYESFGYQPSDTLRHLVQVRDYECTFPACSRHARESDFEHAVPYHEGGRTCACNAGARSRQCHRVKQSPGWTVTQPRPGWHHWTTPAGRCYAQGPKRYPS